MKLIVNSDDFGYSRGHNYGIIDSYLAGVLTATTLMNNVPATEHAYELAKKHPGLDVGIHFVLTHGNPLADVEKIPSLVNPDGSFLSLANLRQRKLNPAEIYYEWSLQLQRQLENGVRPSHADSHHHVHMIPEIFAVYCRLVSEHHLAIRLYRELIPVGKLLEYEEATKELTQPDLFRGDFYEGKISFDYFKSLPLTEDVSVEVMTHPAYLDARIRDTSTYNLDRVEETAILTDPALKAFLLENHVEIISFKELR